MRYIIMADGEEKRWKHYKNIYKCQITVNGETLINRTVRLINKFEKNADIVITTHDNSLILPPNVSVYAPKNNIYEIDRFTVELIENNICFLYGDTFYTEDAMKKIVTKQAEKCLFFGNTHKIFAVKIREAFPFYIGLQYVRQAFEFNKNREVSAWDIYHIINDMPLSGRDIGDGFCCINDNTTDINSPEEYEVFLERRNDN